MTIKKHQRPPKRTFYIFVEGINTNFVNHLKSHYLNRLGSIIFTVKYFPGGWSRTATKAIKLSQATTSTHGNYQKGLVCLDANSLSAQKIEQIQKQCEETQLKIMF